ncbi:MAG: proline dehydrogenase family protein [Acidobacteriota bacterium]|nr:proline dehydrogenase family protein [Acidobacteriota bacterium]
MLRSLLLFLSQQAWLRHWIETSSITGKLTSRFVAGNSLDAEIAVCQRLNAEKILTSVDYLGENVTSLEEADQSRDTYFRILERIAAVGLQSTVSIKLTQLGLDLSEEHCRANLEKLVKCANETGSGVEVDMESSEYTDRTLSIVADMHAKYGNVRAVIQAYLYRSEKDIEWLSERKIPVRLCKGAYSEPPVVAFAKKGDVDANYVRLMKALLDRGTDPAIASHDESILTQALQYIEERRVDPASFEFQMLYGIRRDLQQRLVGKSYKLRLYVPYGDAWYPYFMRRLAERPANVVFLVRNLLRN